MRIDTAHVESEQSQLTLPEVTKDIQVIQVEPEDSVETVLMALRLQPGPVILLLPEEPSQAFDEASHFAQLRQVSTSVRFVLPQSRMETLGSYARQFGFPVASSLETAVEGSQESAFAPEEQRVGASPAHLEIPPPMIARRSRVRLVALMVAILVVASVLLFPALFSAETGLMSTTQPTGASPTTTVGQVFFLSSGQLDPLSSTGLNDRVSVSLSQISAPTAGKGYFAWLLPDKTDTTTKPLLLGKLSVVGGKAQLMHADQGHRNLLATYSGFEVTEQDGTPTTPSLHPVYVGSIPDTPTPGDENHYSLLAHMRHLLADDAMLQGIGLQGGLDIWLYRNAGKIVEWSSAARDSWTGGQQTDLIHRHMLRVLEYLDGTAYVSGDVPPGSPVLVDPQAGRIGLVEVSPTQVLPAFLTHIDIHLQGMVNAPGSTQAQKQLSSKIDQALKTDTQLLQNVRKAAIKLVQMNGDQLQGSDALGLLNDMVTNANTAYVGQFDPTIGGNVNGIVWIHNELQGLATLPVTSN